MFRHQFFKRIQHEGETIEQFITAIKKLSLDCEFGELKDSLVKDRITAGVRNNSLKEKLLREDMDLEKCIKTCKSSEMAEYDLKLLMGEQTIHQVKSKNVTYNNNQHYPKFDNKQYNKNKMGIGNNNPSNTRSHQSPRNNEMRNNCGRCGKNHEKLNCPAFNQRCNICNKVGHFYRLCKTSQNYYKSGNNFSNYNNNQSNNYRNNYSNRYGYKQNVNEVQNVNSLTYSQSQNESNSETNCKFLGSIENSIAKNKKSWYEKIILVEFNAEINCKLDSGADCNVLSFNTIKNFNIKLFKNDTKLMSYNGTGINVIGYCFINCQIKSKAHNLKFYIVEDDSVPILGLPTIESLSLVKRIESILNSVHNNYKDVFHGLGEIKGFEYDIQLKSDYVPKIMPPRNIPFPIREEFFKELDKMENEGIIRKVDEPTEFVSQLVIIKKDDGKLRICLDPQVLNECIQREHYQMPTFEQISARLKNAKFFSTLDCSKAFYQIRLSNKSSLYTTFNTPKGRFCFNRMPYGIISATDIYQKKFKETFKGIPNIEIYVDEILIWAMDENEHECILEEVMKRARDYNIKFNISKCKFGQTSLKFLGHIFTIDGIRIDDEKVKAIKNMKKPTDKKSIQRLLGMITYLSRYIKNLSDLTEPLRELIRKNVPFEWDQKHDDAYSKIIQIITDSPTLSYYDNNNETKLSVDASSTGVGAVIIQNGRPIAYASKALTNAQRNWAQIEKEASAILFACEKFHQYIAGKRIIVETDHKPLLPIFRKPLSEIPVRLQKIRMRLQGYDINLTYSPGKDLVLADTLSRAHLDESEEDKDLMDSFILMINLNENMSEKRCQEIIEETKNDEEMKVLKNFIRDGWPDYNHVPEIVKQYSTFRHEIYENDGLLWRNNCLIIPLKFRKEMLKKLHYNHMGIEKTILRAKELLFWPGMSKQINDLITNCNICIKYQRSLTKEEMIQNNTPTGPWQVVGTDIFYFKNNNYLLLVDYYSKYVELALLENLLASTTINHMKSIFARYGIPYVVRSDGGPQYNNYSFKEFATTYNFQHIMSSPNYPQSNGLAERYIQTIKRILKKADEDERDHYLALLEYRNTPISKDISSPNKIMFGRQTRSILPILINDNYAYSNQINTGEYEARRKDQIKSKYYYNRNARNLNEFDLGDQVRVQSKDKKWDESAKIIGKNEENPRQYTLLKENGNIVKRNRIHISKDSINKQFIVNPKRYDLESNSTNNQNDIVINDMIDDKIELNNTNNVNEPRITNVKHEENTNLINVDNENLVRYNDRMKPKRTIKPPAYLNDYIRY